jgi:hypothetical protein
MNSDIDNLLNHVDKWKFKVHKKLKRMTTTQRKAFWKQVHDEARARGLPVAETQPPTKRPRKRVRTTG